MGSPIPPRPTLSRRAFLWGAGAGLAAGVPLAWLAQDGWRSLREADRSPFRGRTREDKNAVFAMPGPFKGRVVEVRHPGVVLDDDTRDQRAVRAMMDRGMCRLTDADHPNEAWRRFFQKGDVVGIKVNPVGRKPNPGEIGRIPGSVGSISSPEVLLEVVRGLKSAGVRPADIIVFERYAREFRDAGYEKVMSCRDMDGTRWFASSLDYDNIQVDIEGYDSTPGPRRPERDPHVVGYDPDVFVSMGFASDEHDVKDDRRFRTHLSVIVTRMVDKIVTIPCLKDHRSAGVTLALKNLSHGMNNNVARSHLAGVPTLGDNVYGPNQCNTFIPTAVAQLPTRQKAVLHILDGLVGVYEGGPGCWNRTWATWRNQGLFFATDPVAMDMVGWHIIDAKRALEGWLPVADMGLLNHKPPVSLSPRLTVQASLAGPEAAARAIAEYQAVPDGSASESFNLRTPDHVLLAGEIGLGTRNPNEIEHRLQIWDPLQRRWLAG
jgi:uncharacterized protein (DUF362 family)